MLDQLPDSLPSPSDSGLAGDILSAADYTYLALAEREGYDPQTIYQQGGACFKASDLMRDSMAGEGYPVRTDTRNGRGVSHRYVVLGMGSDELVIDLTWQQFLGGAVENAPKVLVGTRTEVVAIAREYGVANDVLKFWAPLNDQRVGGAVLNLLDS